MAQNTTISGVVNIDKPPGLTSHDIVARVRKLLTTHYKLQTKVKVGHTGTLDPFATGVLLVVLGSATRLIQFTHAWDKEYVATFTLGAVSDTDDITGRMTPLRQGFAGQAKSQIPMTKIKNSLEEFIGPIQQTPPAYSAVKIKGKKLYEYAREGLAVGETKQRSITIHEIEILQYNYPELTLRIRCGTGTYIRSLARDLGEKLGTGAYVSSLQRTRIGQFDIKESVSLNKLSTGIQQYIHNPASLIDHLPHLTLTSHNIENMRQGKVLPLLGGSPPARGGVSGGGSGEKTGDSSHPIAFFDERGTLLGIATYDPATSLLSPRINL